MTISQCQLKLLRMTAQSG